MKLLAHRGQWLEREEMNSFHAFERAWSNGYGIETDLRDLDGAVVISHDPPERGVRSLDEFLAGYAARGAGTPLALNIKADGLLPLLKRSALVGDGQWFAFDMSIPETIRYVKEGFAFYSRVSEYEGEAAVLENSAGAWLDSFRSEWWSLDLLVSLAQHAKRVCVVSPELHGRAHHERWAMLRETFLASPACFSICTDFPQEARELLGGQNH
jgi:hypothetical protein